jgi:homoserine dehydrogenase
MQVLEILTEGKTYADTTSELSSAELSKKLFVVMKKLEKEGQKVVTEPKTHAAAPDTSKFRTTAQGFVELADNVTIHGSYNMSNTYNKFLKIGSAIHTGDKQALVNKFFKELKKYVPEYGTENTHIKCSDGKQISIAYTYGSAWGGIGVRVR